LFLLVWILFFPACTSEYRAAKKFEKANAALREGDAERAADLYYDAYQIDPTGSRAAEALFEYARTLEVHQQSFALAAEFYRRLVRLFPEDDLARQALERSASIEADHLGNPEKALLDIQRLNELFPDSPHEPAWKLLAAECYLRLGNAPQAETELRELLGKHPDLPKDVRRKAQSELGHILLVAERPGEAARVFEELANSLSHEPEDRSLWLEARFDLAQALSEIDETDRALDVYREIESEFPRQEIIQEKINLLTIRQQKRNR
ncbi:MAG: tetratricopeptide repeat protein, partial [Bdellovibrionota bacterium]